MGNRASLTSNAGSSLYHYPANSNHLSSIQGANAKTYSYDAAGNLINDGTRQFTYDSLGRLTLVTEGRTQAVYELNGLGQRVAKNTKQFFYDEQGRLIGEYTATGRLIQEIIYLGDTPIAVIRPRAVYYVYADHLDTPRSITTDTNTVVWTWQSDPFGFPGQYYDEVTGLHYNWFRFYDAKVGRYITSDPFGLLGGLNTYAYVGANPLSWRDPLGLAKSSIECN